mmetsp:Transcript_23269/g.35403  ORF Transcript_23269/g.35403 Transcript_23269/m.35403 type:complete len:337 (+) Transcript_23269:301-1311(+)|eukprot:CAMPEP_0117026418 /NCGR_PEP_ID=MMETSP0472-20121206/19427_1 /TAXON_ID=693140 ORGANISM="Tiarina fusus, Strain LIS" /NCGR_SAMPLE_ID=MMETSP0472 /ASSEMBLY_ACC=CAM_ASM_000603 /LENGTH=336 /DNA_ID=CAMNT_0004733425 /DNA_START=301 /DNA_END=1311 /DNA_ORIENTATION=+
MESTGDNIEKGQYGASNDKGEQSLLQDATGAAATRKRKMIAMWGLGVSIVFFVVFFWIRDLIAKDNESYQVIYVEPDDLFNEYGNPNEDATSDWQCNRFAGNTKCWNDEEAYLLIGSSWTQIRGSSSDGGRELFTHSNAFSFKYWKTDSSTPVVPVRWLWLYGHSFRPGYNYDDSAFYVSSVKYTANSSNVNIDVSDQDGDYDIAHHSPVGDAPIELVATLEATPLSGTSSSFIGRPWIKFQNSYFDSWPANINRKVCMATGEDTTMNATAYSIECSDLEISVTASADPQMVLATSCGVTSSSICDYSDPLQTICCSGMRYYWSYFIPNLYIELDP